MKNAIGKNPASPVGLFRLRNGFTLVEVLIVIGVLAVLAALLIPTLGRARSMARNVECRNNLRQWSVALITYSKDCGGYIPRRGQGERELRKIDRDSDWFNCLPPYVEELPYRELAEQDRLPRAGDKSIFICPVATQTDSDYFLPYAMNRFLSSWDRPDPHHITEVIEQSKVVFLADAPGPFSSTGISDKPWCVTARHDGEANLLFLDGHTESFTAEYLGCGSDDPHRPDVRWDFSE